MKKLLIFVSLILAAAGSAVAAGSSGDTAGRIMALNGRIQAMTAGNAGVYARDLLESARTTSMAAQIAYTAGQDTIALQKLELADMQLAVAEAKSAEKEIAEETAVRRAELKKLEAQLEQYLQGEDHQ